jgi:hypothetical protein
VAEYNRDGNLNTPEYWDKSWERLPDGPASIGPVHARVAEILAGLEKRRVVEYGFGHLALAERLGKEQWEGRDFSRVAVAHARKRGYRAFVTRCGDSPGYRKAYLVALAVLEHLDEDELHLFLEKSQHAPHAIFAVPVLNEHVDIKKHMRGWDRAVDFESFLRQWWPYVEVEVCPAPGGRRLIAHCTHTRPEVPPLLTVGSSTLLDFHGAHWTFKSLRTMHGDFGGKVEFVLCDNHPEPTTRFRGVRGIACDECKKLAEDGPVCKTCAQALADMEEITHEQGARYIRWSEKQGTYPGKNRLKVEARGKWVLTMDSHVLLTPHALETVIEHIEADPENEDFYHFPCLFRSSNPTRPGSAIAIDHRNQSWIYLAKEHPEKGPTYGWTGLAKKPGEPYPIAAMITSCYLVKRAAWFSAKGYDPILGNYGGWEGPLQLKWWLMGRRVLQLRHKVAARNKATPEGFLYHEHQFCQPGKRLANKTGIVHGGMQKQRNFAASSAVIGGEAWAKRHCELKGWNFESDHIQAGVEAGMALRPWMVANLGRPEWEDITEFFRWMRDVEKIPGALTVW